MNWFIFIDFYDILLPIELKLGVIFVSVLGYRFSWVWGVPVRGEKSFLMGHPLLNYRLSLMWFLVPLSSQKVISLSSWLGLQLLKVLDQG